MVALDEPTAFLGVLSGEKQTVGWFFLGVVAVIAAIFDAVKRVHAYCGQIAFRQSMQDGMSS